MSEPTLPDRLRQRARFARNLGHPHAPLDEEAADELDRLTAENEALRELVRLATVDQFGICFTLHHNHETGGTIWSRSSLHGDLTPEQADLIRSCVEGGGT